MTPIAQACHDGPMRRPGPPSFTPPIIWGTVSLVTCLALVALWNVVIVTDTRHLMRLPTTSGIAIGWRWVVLVLGCVLFAAIIAGLIFFFVSLVQQIRLNRAQQAFIDAMTHELKTPLTSVRLQLQTMQRLKHDVSRQDACMRAALEDVDRLDSMLDRVLTAARLGRAEAPAPVPVALLGLLDEICGEVSSRHGLSGDEIRTTGEDQIVHSVPEALRTVFLNLVDNAVKYSDAPVRVTVALEGSTRGSVTIKVQDQGHGLHPNQLPRVFQRFYRVPDARGMGRPGSGLGLYIVRETLRLLGGRIAVRSHGLGKGSAFVVTLPVGRSRG